MKLNNYDTNIIASIEEQFKEIKDPKGIVVKPETYEAEVQFGTLSLAAEKTLVENGYTVENKMPMAKIFRRK